VTRTGVDATRRDGAQISSGDTGLKVAGAMPGSSVRFQTAAPDPMPVIAPMAGEYDVVSGYHSPTIPCGNETLTSTSRAVGE